MGTPKEGASGIMSGWYESLPSEDSSGLFWASNVAGISFCRVAASIIRLEVQRLCGSFPKLRHRNIDPKIL